MKISKLVTHTNYPDVDQCIQTEVTNLYINKKAEGFMAQLSAG